MDPCDEPLSETEPDIRYYDEILSEIIIETTGLIPDLKDIVLKYLLRDRLKPGAQLQRYKLHEVSIFNKNLRHANLYNANIFRSDFALADLSHADLRKTTFRCTTLSEANLTGAFVEGMILDERNCSFPPSGWEFIVFPNNLTDEEFKEMINDK